MSFPLEFGKILAWGSGLSFKNPESMILSAGIKRCLHDINVCYSKNRNFCTHVTQTSEGIFDKKVYRKRNNLRIIGNNFLVSFQIAWWFKTLH